MIALFNNFLDVKGRPDATGQARARASTSKASRFWLGPHFNPPAKRESLRTLSAKLVVKKEEVPNEELVTAESIDDVAYQLEETIDVKPGDKLLISPVVTGESVETYQVFSFDLNTGEIPAINREESLRVEYLITGGGFVDGPPFGSMQFSSNGHISTIWTLPNDRKKMDEDAIIAVIRDQRGGTSVSEITVRYIEDGDPEASAFGF